MQMRSQKIFVFFFRICMYIGRARIAQNKVKSIHYAENFQTFSYESRYKIFEIFDFRNGILTYIAPRIIRDSEPLGFPDN